MRKRALPFLLAITCLLAVSPRAFAETRTLSWSPVTTYTDGSPIEAGKTITYTAYWTTDSGLSIASLRTIGTSLPQNSTTFDPGIQGMTRGSTVYFTAKAVLDTGEESILSPAFSWIVPVVSVPAVLSSIAVSGPASVNEGGTGTYTATATWDNGSTTSVAPTWSENSSYATISTGGVLTASAVTSNQTVTVTASYSSGGVTRSATQNVGIVDVPALAPAAPQNMGITGPVSTGPVKVWRIAWEPVTTYANGTPLEPGRTVRYSAYWTDDPALPAGSLRQLASSISATNLDFDPIGRQMVKNREAYLMVRADLDNGAQSALAVPLVWVAANEGPVPPAWGKIIKK